MSSAESEARLRVALVEAMGELRAAYRPELVVHISAVRQAVLDAQTSSLAAADVERVRVWAHRLRGTSGSHGFDAVSAAAGALQAALVAWTEKGASADATLAALESAMGALDQAAEELAKA